MACFVSNRSINNKASSPYNNSTIGAIDDLDALIVVDIQFIDGSGLNDDVSHQIANIQFNNLDIIGEWSLLNLSFAVFDEISSIFQRIKRQLLN